MSIFHFNHFELCRHLDIQQLYLNSIFLNVSSVARYMLFSVEIHYSLLPLVIIVTYGLIRCIMSLILNNSSQYIFFNIHMTKFEQKGNRV